MRPHLCQRDLPEHDAYALRVQGVHHRFRIGPRAVGGKLEVGEKVWAAVGVDAVAGVAERRERRLVAPRLDNDNADGYVLLAVPGDLG
jgi:hypothetical protein